MRTWALICASFLALSCGTEEEPSCPPIACNNTSELNIAAEADASALPNGQYSIELQTDVGSGTVACTVPGSMGSKGCTRTGDVPANGDVGADGAITIWFTWHQPASVSVVVRRDGTALLTKTWSPQYHESKLCDMLCRSGEDTIRVGE